MWVEGRFRNRSYDDKKGMRHNVTEIYAENIELLSPKKDVNNSSEAPKSNDLSNQPF